MATSAAVALELSKKKSQYPVLNTVPDDKVTFDAIQVAGSSYRNVRVTTENIGKYVKSQYDKGNWKIPYSSVKGLGNIINAIQGSNTDLAKAVGDNKTAIEAVTQELTDPKYRMHFKVDEWA